MVLSPLLPVEGCPEPPDRTPVLVGSSGQDVDRGSGIHFPTHQPGEKD